MYSTCTYCNVSLGQNESLEYFPVGRRLAFDQSKGRLWVVCAQCRQWNLSPIETRWEAIEEAEKRYRDTPRRVATDQIGLARLPDGTELVRIGQPLRPEFAAWRYGDRFAARWRRRILWGGAGVAAFAGYTVAGPALGLVVGGLSTLPFNLASMLQGMYESRLVVGRFVDEQGPVTVNASMLIGAKVHADPEHPQGWSVKVAAVRGPHPTGRFGPAASLFGDHRVVLRGESAQEAARVFLPRLNNGGGRRSTVEEAVRHLERTATPDDAFRQITRSGREGGWSETELAKLPAPIRLALEMAAHEDLERRALEGELSVLETQWREAEEVAAIADNLTLPMRVSERLERLLRDR